MIQFNENKRDLIAEGGEGKIYTYKNDYIVKIFKDTVDTRTKIKKIKTLMSLRLPKTVVVPIDFVCNRYQDISGYIMKRIDGEELQRLASRKFVKSNGITKKDILKMLTDIQDTLIELHTQHIYVGDLNDLNILFDRKYHVYFIDIDSWTVGQYKCDVVNESFQDPDLIQNNFNEKTDAFAFDIIVYKALTRLHPFSGAYQPDINMDLFRRIELGITAIDNDDVKIPRMVDSDVFMPKKLLNVLKDVFENSTRVLPTSELHDFYTHLTMCPHHGDYYYGNYNTCPICDNGAYEVPSLTKVGNVGGIPIRVLFKHPDVKLMFTALVYLDVNNMITFRNSSTQIPYDTHAHYDVNTEGNVFYKITTDKVFIQTPHGTIEVDRKYKSSFAIVDNDIYIVTDNLTLTQFGVMKKGTAFTKQLEKVSINNVFNVVDENTYFVCNSYDARKILSVSGYTHELENTAKIVNHSIVYDAITKTWLFIFESAHGHFYTYIIDAEKGVIYERDNIRYIGNIQGIAYNNGFMYKPSDGAIVRFNYTNNEYKEFDIDIITTETQLIKNNTKFFAVTEKRIYEIG